MLTRDQKYFFHKKGYLVLENFIDQKKIITPIINEYASLLDNLIREWSFNGLVKNEYSSLNFFEKLKLAYKEGYDWFQPMDISLPGNKITVDTPMHFGPAVFNLIIYEELLDVISEIIGDEITSNPIQHIRLKPPSKLLHKEESRAHITYTDWHQDRGVALKIADKTQMVTVWVAITDSNINNGCLQVMEKTDSLLPHCPKIQTAIVDDFIQKDQIISLEVKSGSIIILDPLTPHSSLPNFSEDFRWSFDIRYNKTGEPTGREHFPEFIARSKLKPEIEITDWRIWKNKWENSRKNLANKKHIPIHRWTSNSPYCA